MSCRQVTALLDAFLDGELPPEGVFEVEEHLSTCGACEERERFESALRSSMKRVTLSAARPSAGFDARLAGALRAERERILEQKEAAAPPSRSRRTAMLPLLLAAATTFGFVLFLNRHFGTSSQFAAQPSPAPAAPVAAAMMDPEQVLDELVDYHARPPEPEITDS
ncbi:MAG TPA: zf-HC2 domain-containing protein, partial [Polyangiaceae bacterium]|nr:zf-HC2 domain-containing protein [Polyangiaceae bacterium]